MGKNNSLVLALLALTALVVLFVVARCVLSCKKADLYTRRQFGQQSHMHRSQVDYASNLRLNPHYMANPESKYQALSEGVDLYADQRKLDEGTMWMQYDNERPEPPSMYPRNSKTRYDLRLSGELDAARRLDNVTYDQNVEENVTAFRMHGNELGRPLCANDAGNYVGYKQHGMCMQ
jgi:hypothetical protein